jgi:site-specific recombinase XerD
MTSPTITIYVRHGGKCKSTDETSKQCRCPKHLRWTKDGKQHRVAAKVRSWAEAETKKREMEDQFSGKLVEAPKEAPKTIEEAARLFIANKVVESVGVPLIARYKRELQRLQTYCESKGVYVVGGITRELMTGYVGTWVTVYPSSYTRSKVKERLSGFLKYCFEERWLDRKPKLPNIVVDSPPTMPLNADEYDRLLAAVPVAITDPTEAIRARSLIQLMRWTGLAIRDAVTLERAEIQKTGDGYLVTTNRQKTGTHVSVPIQAQIAEEILRTPNSNPKYIFWDGVKDEENFSREWGTNFITPVFEAAEIPDVCFMKSHRLRDTFAVELLIKDVPLEDVAKLLGNTIRIAEKHYAAWVPARQNRLNALVTATWA